jgi:hypothetical protein
VPVSGEKTVTARVVGNGYRALVDMMDTIAPADDAWARLR